MITQKVLKRSHETLCDHGLLLWEKPVTFWGLPYPNCRLADIFVFLMHAINGDA